MVEVEVEMEKEKEKGKKMMEFLKKYMEISLAFLMCFQEKLIFYLKNSNIKKIW